MSSIDDPSLLQQGSHGKRHAHARRSANDCLVPTTFALLDKIPKDTLMQSSDMYCIMGTVQNINAEHESKTIFQVKEPWASTGGAAATHLIHQFNGVDQQYIVDGASVRVFGKPRFLDGSRYIRAESVRPLSGNAGEVKIQIELHKKMTGTRTLTATGTSTTAAAGVSDSKKRAREENKGAVEQKQTEAKAPSATAVANYAHLLDDDGKKLVNKSPLHVRVFKAIFADPSESGITKEQIKSMIPSSSMEHINNVILELDEGGLVYSTIDVDHWKTVISSV